MRVACQTIFLPSKALLVWSLSSGKDWRVILRLGLEWGCFWVDRDKTWAGGGNETGYE